MSICSSFKLEPKLGRRGFTSDKRDIPVSFDVVSKLRLHGYKQNEVAKFLNISRKTLSRKYRWRWCNGYLPDKLDIKALRTMGYTQEQVCQTFHIDHKTLTKYKLWG